VAVVPRGRHLQRFFSGFPDGWPGLGLLLLRLAIGSSALLLAVGCLGSSDGRTIGAMVLSLVVALVGLAIVLGFMTPMAGTMAAVVHLLSLFSGRLTFCSPLSGRPLTENIELAVLSIALVLLGPGAFSLDARLFGRREIIIPDISSADRP
jgi:putative oxidoreductase